MFHYLDCRVNLQNVQKIVYYQPIIMDNETRYQTFLFSNSWQVIQYKVLTDTEFSVAFQKCKEAGWSLKKVNEGATSKLKQLFQKKC